jgi:hypothetical protein
MTTRFQIITIIINKNHCFLGAVEGIFAKSIGYEINPALHIVANVRRILTPRYWYTTNFYMTDLWKTKK